jgi:hypothetical protein
VRKIYKNGGKRESIFTFYLKIFPVALEKIIGLQFDEIKIEHYDGGKFIDLYAVNHEQRIEIFVENQIGPSDRTNHLKTKIIPLIERIHEGYVVWTAKEFNAEHIKEVKQLIDNTGKYINFYTVKINEEVLKKVGYLDTINPLEILGKLYKINAVGNILILVDTHLKIPTTHKGKAIIEDNKYDFNEEKDMKEYLLRRLNNAIPFYLNLHNSKKHNKNDRILQIGAGVGGVTYFCSALDRYQRAIVGIRFEYSKIHWYKYFKEKENLLKIHIDSNLHFDNRYRKIFWSMESNKERIPKVVNEIINVFRRFIIFFSPYIFEGKLNEIDKNGKINK